MVMKRPGHQVHKCPHGKGKSRRTPGHECETGPLNDLTEMVRAGDIIKEASPRDHIPGFTGFPKMDQDIVGLPVYQQPSNKHGDPRNEPRVCEP